MNIQKWVVLITFILILNTYYDGKIFEYFGKGKKYYTMLMYGFVGLSLYMFIKKHPNESKNMFVHANSLVKYMPIDKGTSELLTPFMDFTSIHEKMSNISPLGASSNITPQFKRMLNSGNIQSGGQTKRCVSESKKKYVAAKQQWKCGYCQTMLDETYEVDHKVDLQYGGTNHVTNLVATCPTCHRKKTMQKYIH